MPSLHGGRRTLGILPWRDSSLPTVSIITVTYNSREFVTDCITSVLSQDYPNVEYIVVDGGSKDGTVDILRSFDDRIDVWQSEPDEGIYDAWNKGLALASGDWIAYLGSDDLYFADAVSRYMSLAEHNPDADFLSSRAVLMHTSSYAPIFGAEWRWPACARRLTTINVGTMHNRRLFDRYGRFDASYRSAGDYEFLLRAGGDLKTAFMQAVTVKMRAGGASESTANLYERERAKVSRGVRGVIAARFERIVDIARFHVRRSLLTAWTRLNPRSKRDYQ